MNYLLPVIIVIFLLVATTLSRRNRQRALALAQQQREEIRFGTEVVTTSGLYGTVVGINDDDTVQLAIAPGVEVKWALAALRDVASIPPDPASAPASAHDEIDDEHRDSSGGPDDSSPHRG